MAKHQRLSSSKTEFEDLEQPVTMPEGEHPDYVGGVVTDSGEESCDCDDDDIGEATGDLTPLPGGPLPTPFPGPRPFPITPRIPAPFPWPRFCGPVSGKYRYSTPLQMQPWFPVPLGPIPQPTGRPVVPRRIPGPIIPINLMNINVRVDVDRFFPQNRISIEVSRLFPRATAHAIAEVTSDICSGFNRRTVRAQIVYRDGQASLIPGTTVTFTARRTTGFNYSEFKLQLSGRGIRPRTYNLSFQSRYFDSVQFEVDRVSNSGFDRDGLRYGYTSQPAGEPAQRDVVVGDSLRACGV